MTKLELATWASAETMIPDAPVHARRSIEINASIEVLWTKMTAVSEWPRWYPYLKNAKLYGPFAKGTRLTYGGPFKHDLRIAKVKTRELVMIYGNLMGYSAITRWDFQIMNANRTKVTFSESSSGFLIGALYSCGSLGRHLEQWLQSLRSATDDKSR